MTKPSASADLPNGAIADWGVLLVGGAAAVGKTTLAKAIARETSCPLLQVDDLWIAMQRAVSLDVLPQLHAFSAPDTFDSDPTELLRRKIELAELLSTTLEAVVANHLHNEDPVVIEGVWITPRLAARSSFDGHVRPGRVRAVFIDEPDRPALLGSMLVRGRGIETWTPARQQTMAALQSLYAEWLRDEAARYALPLVAAQPRATLLDRVRRIL